MTSLNYTFNSSGNNINNLHSNGITITGITDNGSNTNNNNSNSSSNSISNSISINGNNLNNGGIIGPRTLLHPLLDSTTPRASTKHPNISFGPTSTPATTGLNTNNLLSASYDSSSIINPTCYRSSLQFTPNGLNTNTNANGNHTVSYQQPQSQHYSYSSNFVPKLNPSNTQSSQTDDIGTNNSNNNYTLQNVNGLFARSSLSYEYKNPMVQNNEYDNSYINTINTNATPISTANSNSTTKDTKFLSLLNNPILRNNNNNSLIDYSNYIPGNSSILQQSPNHPRLSISSQHFNPSTVLNTGPPPPPPLMTPNIKTEPSNQYRAGHSLSFSGPTTVSSSNLSALSAHSPGVSSSSVASTHLYQQKQQNNQKMYSQPVSLRSLSISSNASTTLSGGNIVPSIVNPRYSISSSYNPNTIASVAPFNAATTTTTTTTTTSSANAAITENTNNNNEYPTSNLNSIINSDLSPKSTYASLNSNASTQNNGSIYNKDNHGNNNNVIFTADKDGKEDAYPHKCNQCMKSFKRKSWLKRHLLSHSTERHFFCQWCLSRHKRKDNLLQHMKLKHPKYLYQELRLANVPFKWQRSKNINFDNIPDDKRIDYVDSIKSLIYQGVLSKEDVKRVLNEIIERNR